MTIGDTTADDSVFMVHLTHRQKFTIAKGNEVLGILAGNCVQLNLTYFTMTEFHFILSKHYKNENKNSVQSGSAGGCLKFSTRVISSLIFKIHATSNGSQVLSRSIHLGH